MRAWIVTLALVSGPAAAQDKKTIDNPTFANWAKFKAGTSVTLKMTNDASGVKSASTMTTKLVEVTADELTVETTTESEVMGMKFTTPSAKQVHKKTIEVPANVKVPEVGAKPEGTTEEGTETLKVGATEMMTKWYKYKAKTPAGDIDSQLWTSDEVPGMLVKMVTKGDKFSSTLELTELKK